MSANFDARIDKFHERLHTCMDGYNDTFFFTQKSLASNVYTTEAVVALARKLHTVQRHRDVNRSEAESPSKSFSPALEIEFPEAIEPPKPVSPIPVFSSSWNPDEQPLKFVFDKLRWDSVRLLNELAIYLYGFQWSTANGGSGAKLHPRLVSFLQVEYDELTEGCSVVYYRWQSKKYQERYLSKLKVSGAEQDAAPSVVASGTARGGIGASGTGGSSSSLHTSQQQLNTFRNRLGSANSITMRSDKSEETGTSHVNQLKPRRKASSPIEWKISEVSDENRSTSKAIDKHSQSRVQFLWSATARQKQRDAENNCSQPVVTTSVPVNQLISAEVMPSATTKNSARASSSAPVGGDVYKGFTYLKRMTELFREMARKRESEERRWLESGRIYACRVICHGDRRSMLMSRSKSAAIPTSAASLTSLSLQLPLTPTTPPVSAKQRASTAPFSPTTKLPADNQSIIPAFAVLSSLNNSIQHQSFHINDAFQGKVPRIIPESAVFKRSIFLAALPDGSYSAYYHNGKPAVVQSCYLTKSLPSKAHTTTVAHDHTAVGDVILVATPSTLYAYAPKYDKRLFADRTNLTIITAEITVERHPDWHSKKLKSCINFEVNDHLTLAIHQPDRITLTFFNQATNESFKFALGFNLHSPVPAPDTKYLQTSDIELQSKSAQELIKTVGKGKGSVQQGRGLSFSMSSQRSTTLTKSEQIAKKLGFIDNTYVSDVSAQLKRLRNKISWICESWLSHYCLWLGVIEIRGLATDYPAERVFNRNSARRLNIRSAELPSAYSDDELGDNRRPESGSSDGGTLRKKRTRRAVSSEAKMSSQSPTSPPIIIGVAPTTEQLSNVKDKIPRTGSVSESRQIQLERVKQSAQQPSTLPSAPAAPAPVAEISATPKNIPLTEVQLIGVCPASLRRYMVNGLEVSNANSFCHCSRRKPPIITDAEYELYVQKFAPQNQIIVVQVVDSRKTSATHCGAGKTASEEIELIVDEIYSNLSLYRPRPCVDSISDRFRLCRYDLAAASTAAITANYLTNEVLSLSSSRRVPLLIWRHNVRRGMTLMYYAGGLISCGFITPSTADALLRQIEYSWRLALKSFELPPDFRVNMSALTITSLSDWETASATKRQADAFVSKYISACKVKVQDNDQELDEDAIVAASIAAREGPHTVVEFPCLHVPSL